MSTTTTPLLSRINLTYTLPQKKKKTSNTSCINWDVLLNVSDFESESDYDESDDAEVGELLPRPATSDQ
jgi:hypothetical protein